MAIHTKTAPHDGLTRYLVANFDQFTPTQRALANYLLANLDEASFLTADEMAAKINTTSSTVVRFAKEIGYGGYPELQKDLRKLMMTKVNSIGPLEQAKQFKVPNEQDVIEFSLARDLANLNRLIEIKEHEAVRKFVDLFASSRRKYIVALRSLFSVGHFLFFQARKILPDVFFLSNFDGGIYDVIRELTHEDLVIALSFPRYCTPTVEFAQLADAKGARIAAITDSKISPLFKLSKVCLFSPHDSPSFFTSH